MYKTDIFEQKKIVQNKYILPTYLPYFFGPLQEIIIFFLGPTKSCFSFVFNNDSSKIVLNVQLFKDQGNQTMYARSPDPNEASISLDH